MLGNIFARLQREYAWVLQESNLIKVEIQVLEAKFRLANFKNFPALPVTQILHVHSTLLLYRFWAILLVVETNLIRQSDEIPLSEVLKNLIPWFALQYPLAGNDIDLNLLQLSCSNDALHGQISLIDAIECFLVHFEQGLLIVRSDRPKFGSVFTTFGQTKLLSCTCVSLKHNLLKN